MSMSTHVVGFREPDEKWHEMKKVFDSCIAAKVEVPRSVYDFFGGSPPDPAGIEMQLDLRPFRSEGSEGFEIDVETLPKNIKTIRFWNSW